MGLKHEQAHGSLGLTLGQDSAKEKDFTSVLEALPAVVDRLRRMSPLYSQKITRDNVI